MSRDLFKDVGDFHRKFDLPAYPSTEGPTFLDKEAFDFRVKFMHEELIEFIADHAAGDMAGAADALADLVWVALGTAHMMRIPFDDIWAEVVRANMEKVRATGDGDPRSKRGSRLDVVKPEGWQAPDHRKALGIPVTRDVDMEIS